MSERTQRSRSVGGPRTLLGGALAAALLTLGVAGTDASALPDVGAALEKLLPPDEEAAAEAVEATDGTGSAGPAGATTPHMPTAVEERAKSLLPESPGAKAARDMGVGGTSAAAHVAAPAASTPSVPRTIEPDPMASALADTSSADAGLLDEILLSPEPYYYESVGRRDPFVSLVSEDPNASTDEDRSRPESLVVVGILWGDGDRYALVETMEGKSLVLREGGRFGSATVTRINPDGIVLYVDDYGVGRTVQLKVTDGRKGSKNDRDR